MEGGQLTNRHKDTQRQRHRHTDLECLLLICVVLVKLTALLITQVLKPLDLWDCHNGSAFGVKGALDISPRRLSPTTGPYLDALEHLQLPVHRLMRARVVRVVVNITLLPPFTSTALVASLAHESTPFVFDINGGQVPYRYRQFMKNRISWAKHKERFLSGLRDNMATEGELDHCGVPDNMKGLRACLGCSVVKTFTQFYNE